MTKIELIDWVLLFSSPITQFCPIFIFGFSSNLKQTRKTQLDKDRDFIGYYLENLNPLFNFLRMETL